MNLKAPGFCQELVDRSSMDEASRYRVYDHDGFLVITVTKTPCLGGRKGYVKRRGEGEEGGEKGRGGRRTPDSR